MSTIERLTKDWAEMALDKPTMSNDYVLKTVSTEVVVPALPMPEHTLALSNIDLTFPNLSGHVYFCYSSLLPRTYASALSHLRVSLSRVLVSYYVFAGRLVTDSTGLPEVECNNKGVHFTEAYAAAPLSHLNLYNPDDSVQGKLVPPLSGPFRKDDPALFAVQVTQFSCGGIVVGCTFDHRVADAYSANMFFTSWANLCRNDPPVYPNPSFSRSILCPRENPTCCAEVQNMYVSLTPEEFGKENPPRSCSGSRIYHLDAKNIMDLQLNARKEGNSYTKLESFSAYLWKLLVSTGKELEDTVNSKIGIAVDGRSRLKETGLSANYFGNVIIFPFAESSARNLKTQPLCWSAGLIHDAIKSVANAEQFRSLIDLVETKKPASVITKVYCREDDENSSGPAVIVSSGLRFPLYEVDYGWGRPTFASCQFPWSSETGYVMPTQSPAGDGSWMVYMYLPLQQLYAIESDPNRILVPITADFLHLG